MRKWMLILTVIAVSIAATGEKRLRKSSNLAFQRGEKLTYLVHYGLINAGEATLEIKEDTSKILGRKTMHMVATGKSLGAFNWFYKVQDNYESFIDEEAMIPWYFIRDVDEGGYTINRKILFNQYESKAKVEDSTYQVPEYCQDLLSAFYYARTLDLQNQKIGDTITINTFFDYEVYPLKIKLLAKEKVDTDIGEIDCLKFRPLLQVGRVFKEQEDMTLWISNDQRKIPVRLQADLLIGSIKMDIIKAENTVTQI